MFLHYLGKINSSNLLQILKKMQTRKSDWFFWLVKIWESYCQKFGGFLFWDTVYRRKSFAVWSDNAVLKLRPVHPDRWWYKNAMFWIDNASLCSGNGARYQNVANILIENNNNVKLRVVSDNLERLLKIIPATNLSPEILRFCDKTAKHIVIF